MTAEKARTILIVEDTKNLRDIIAYTLRSRGWNVIESADGEDALQQVASVEPDLILLDVMLPGKTGFEVCSTLKGDERTRQIPIVMLSGVTVGSGKSDEHWKSLSNADEFISKPFRAIQLMDCIEGLLKKRSREQARQPVKE